MVTSDAHRAFKDGLYTQLARIGKAVANPHRLELLELLAQSERTVDSLASEARLSLANASQHLQSLREAGLVESRKEGLYVHYRVADDSVLLLSAALRSVAERRLGDLDRLVRDHFGERTAPEPVALHDLLERMQQPHVVVIDTRPANEYAAGHIAGALSIPAPELEERLKRLPRSKEYVAYCRGPYCIYADQAVALLLESGRRARRLREGFPEWKAAGLPVNRTN